MEPKSNKKIIFAIVGVFTLGLAGATLYFWLTVGSDSGTKLKLPRGSSSLAPSPLITGCGNNLCEEGEDFNSCPADCYNPSSSGPELAKLSLAPDDFPPPPRETAWVKFYDQLVENDPARIWPALQNYEPLAVHSAVIRLEASNGLAWDQWGHIEQFILVYPQNKISNAFEAATGGGLNDLAAKAEVSIQELPDPAVGERSKAYKVSGQGDSFYVIFFVKKSFLEYITFRGEKYEYQVFPSLARKAAEKIK